MSKINEFIPGWMSHRKALIELVSTVSEEQLQFKPWDNAMSFSELISHMTGSMEMFVQTVKKGVFTPPSEPKLFQTVAELQTHVQEQTKETEASLETITDLQLEQIVEFYGMKMTGWVLLDNAKDHEIHHKGQLFTYARILRIETLPFFMIR